MVDQAAFLLSLALVKASSRTFKIIRKIHLIPLVDMLRCTYCARLGNRTHGTS